MRVEFGIWDMSFKVIDIEFFSGCVLIVLFNLAVEIEWCRKE